MHIPNRPEGSLAIPGENLPRESIVQVEVLAAAPTMILNNPLSLILGSHSTDVTQGILN
jgi:hypothetical protein